MTQIITSKQVPGFIPHRIFMQRKGKVSFVRCLYIFTGDIPEKFAEAIK